MSPKSTWSPADVPSLHGHRALVTGVTSGLGEHVAVHLARAGADVVLAGRNPDKLGATLGAVREAAPGALFRTLQLDLADLSSVRRAAGEAASLGPISILVNNAGVMGTPNRRTVDGFDLQLGTNHLGHFALTGLLMPQLLASGGARVVTVSSLMARTVRRVSLQDPREQTGRYNRWRSYAQSKLANLLFTLELDRRVRRLGLPMTSVAAHPGYAKTNLVSGMNLGDRNANVAIGMAVTNLVGQSAERGSLPVVMAATAPGLRGGTYVGPDGPFEMNGLPRIVRMPAAAHEEGAASALWSLSEEATGVAYP